MKPLLLFTFGLLLGYVSTFLFNSSSPHRSYDPNALPTKMEIVGCHARFPLSEECQKSIIKPKECDLDKLAYAVAMQETNDCKVGTGRVNNCHGMLIRVNGKRVPIVYKNKEESYEAFKKLWVKRYGGCPDLKKAIKYSGNDRAEIWLKSVRYFYET